VEPAYKRGMIREPNIVALGWDRSQSIKAARSAVRSGSRVHIGLPLEVHYALYRHLHPDAPRGPAEEVDASGGAELLAQIATVAGLEELGELQREVRRGRYRVRVTSPEPLLRLLPPA